MRCCSRSIGTAPPTGMSLYTGSRRPARMGFAAAALLSTGRSGRPGLVLVRPSVPAMKSEVVGIGDHPPRGRFFLAELVRDAVPFAVSDRLFLAAEV
jgi:hypothetical protein